MAVMARSRDIKVLLEVLVSPLDRPDNISPFHGYLGLCVAIIHNFWLNASFSECQDDLSGVSGALSVAVCVLLLLSYLSIHTPPSNESLILTPQ